jgi:hypothetical protein
MMLSGNSGKLDAILRRASGSYLASTCVGVLELRPVLCRRQAVAPTAARWHDGAKMNARTQIKLDPEMQRQAQAKAAELGISFAEYIRRLVSQDLGEPKPKAHISVIFDLGASGEPTNVTRDKDRMIGEALWQEYLREAGRKPRPSRRRSGSKR